MVSVMPSYNSPIQGTSLLDGGIPPRLGFLIQPQKSSTPIRGPILLSHTCSPYSHVLNSAISKSFPYEHMRLGVGDSTYKSHYPETSQIIASWSSLALNNKTVPQMASNFPSQGQGYCMFFLDSRLPCIKHHY